MTSTLASPPQPVHAGTARRGQLAQAFQEAFTAAVRLRARRQIVTDAALFRSQIKQLLGAADQESRRLAYSGDVVKLAVYAYTAFLDELVLNSGDPVFAAWSRQSMQEEIFGDHNAGETFFAYLSDLVNRQDSEEVADLLEVYLLCMLLGFRGRYSGTGGVEGRIAAVQAKIERIRGGCPPIAPRWALPQDEVVSTPADPWLRRLVIAAAATAGSSLFLFVVFWFLLHSQVVELQELTARLVR
jgi:type VI secretion system protein ImpK